MAVPDGKSRELPVYSVCSSDPSGPARGLPAATKVKTRRTLIYKTLQKAKEISFSLKFNFTPCSESVTLSELEGSSPVGVDPIGFLMAPTSFLMVAVSLPAVCSTQGPLTLERTGLLSIATN